MTEAGTVAAPPIELVVIQPTPFCNIDCSYCYLPDRANRAVIRDDVIARIFREVFAWRPGQQAFKIAWHCGEPLVLPPAWYEKAFARAAGLAPQPVKLDHEFQTNGMLITPEWCAFFKQNDLSIGVSIDGPRDIHDRFRRRRNGAGTFDDAMRGIALLREHGVKFGVISVLTSRAFDIADELFEFYESIGVTSVALNCEEIDGVHRKSSLVGTDTVERYKSFLRRFLSRVGKSRQTWSVRPVDALRRLMLSEHRSCGVSPQASKGTILCFDHLGGVTTFSPELMSMQHPPYGTFCLGNIMEQSLSDMLNGGKARALADDIASGVAMCRSSCDYFDLCGGGAPANKLFENGSFATTETLYCRLNIKATAAVLLEGMQHAVVSALRQADAGGDVHP